MPPIKTTLLSTITPNENNPRLIKDDDFKRLVSSLKMDPAILTVKPIILHSKTNLTILAGEKRYLALLELGYTEIPNNWLAFADNLTEEQKKKLIILDNTHAGTWDTTKLTSDWGIDLLTEWDIVIPELTIDFSFPATKEKKTKQPGATDNEYSVFELVMLHTNKVKLLDKLNDIKVHQKFDKLEDALLFLIN